MTSSIKKLLKLSIDESIIQDLVEMLLLTEGWIIHLTLKLHGLLHFRCGTLSSERVGFVGLGLESVIRILGALEKFLGRSRAFCRAKSLLKMLVPTHRKRLLALLPDRFLHTEDFSCDANLGSDLVRPRLADHRRVLLTSVRGLLFIMFWKTSKTKFIFKNSIWKTQVVWIHGFLKYRI